MCIVCPVPASARACPCLDPCRRSQVGTLEFDAWTHDLLLMFIEEFELPDVRLGGFVRRLQMKLIHTCLVNMVSFCNVQ